MKIKNSAFYTNPYENEYNTDCVEWLRYNSFGLLFHFFSRWTINFAHFDHRSGFDSVHTINFRIQFMHFYIMYNVIVTLRVSHTMAVCITISHVLVISFHFVCARAAVLTHKKICTHRVFNLLISVQSNPYLQMVSLFIASSLSQRERVIHTKLFCTSITLCKYSVMCINKNANTNSKM